MAGRGLRDRREDADVARAGNFGLKTRLGICARKRRYASEAEALEVAAGAEITLRAYRCELCRRYHLTSRTKGMRLPKFEIERRNSSKV